MCVYLEGFRGLTWFFIFLIFRWRVFGFGEYSIYRGGNIVFLFLCRKKRYFGNVWFRLIREDVEILFALEVVFFKMLMFKILGFIVFEDFIGIFIRLRKNNLKISNMYVYIFK